MSAQRGRVTAGILRAVLRYLLNRARIPRRFIQLRLDVASCGYKLQLFARMGGIECVW
jgi:hypothetical protein